MEDDLDFKVNGIQNKHNSFVSSNSSSRSDLVTNSVVSFDRPSVHTSFTQLARVVKGGQEFGLDAYWEVGWQVW